MIKFLSNLFKKDLSSWTPIESISRNNIKESEDTTNFLYCDCMRKTKNNKTLIEGTSFINDKEEYVISCFPCMISLSNKSITFYNQYQSFNQREKLTYKFKEMYNSNNQCYVRISKEKSQNYFLNIKFKNKESFTQFCIEMHINYCYSLCQDCKNEESVCANGHTGKGCEICLSEQIYVKGLPKVQRVMFCLINHLKRARTSRKIKFCLLCCSIREESTIYKLPTEIIREIAVFI